MTLVETTAAYLDGLIEDPWRTLACAPSAAGCEVEFADDEFAVRARDAVYYVRAIEEPTPAVNGAGLACQRDSKGACVAIDATPKSPADDRLAPIEERAWSSPIYVSYAPAGEAEAVRARPSEAAPAAPVPQGELDPAWSEPAFEPEAP